MRGRGRLSCCRPWLQYIANVPGRAFRGPPAQVTPSQMREGQSIQAKPKGKSREGAPLFHAPSLRNHGEIEKAEVGPYELPGAAFLRRAAEPR